MKRTKKLASVGELSKSYEEKRPPEPEPRDATGREGDIRKAGDYVGWASRS